MDFGVEQQRFEIGNLAFSLGDLDRPVADRYARRVVAPIFEALQPIHDDGGSFLRAYVAHDSAHERDLLENGPEGAAESIPASLGVALSPESLPGFTRPRNDRERPTGHPPTVR